MKQSLFILAFLISIPLINICVTKRTSAKAGPVTEDFSKEVEIATMNATGTMFNRIYHFEYRGHQYIQFVNGYYDGDRRSYNAHKVAGVVHDPECPCHAKKEISSISSSNEEDSFNF